MCYITTQILRIKVSERIDINKKGASKKCNFVTIGTFRIKVIKFLWYVCNGCHDVLMMHINLNDTAILNISGTDCHCIFNGISKKKAVNLT